MRRLALALLACALVSPAQAQQLYGPGQTKTPVSPTYNLTTSQALAIPTGCNWFRATLIAGGNGGGSGQTGDNTAIRSGGAGGTGGARVSEIYRTADLGGSGFIFATIGTGGTGGTGSTTATGTAGGAGGQTSLFDGNSAGGLMIGRASLGFTPLTSILSGAVVSGEGSSNAGAVPLATGLAAATAVLSNDLAPGGGGAGGGKTVAGAEATGSAGSNGYSRGGNTRVTVGAAGGTVGGGAGVVGVTATWFRGSGSGGGGGGSSATGNGGAGGAGGVPGGGGGGGGAAAATFTSGKGGDGGNGSAAIECFQ